MAMKGAYGTIYYAPYTKYTRSLTDYKLKSILQSQQYMEHTQRKITQKDNRQAINWSFSTYIAGQIYCIGGGTPSRSDHVLSEYVNAQTLWTPQMYWSSQKLQKLECPARGHFDDERGCSYCSPSATSTASCVYLWALS